VFSKACPETDRMVTFRDWLRGNAADARTGVVEAILARARSSIAPDQTV